MGTGEFDLIASYFNRVGLRAESGVGPVSLGIGDDCAILNIPVDHQLALSMDVLVEGVHFPVNAPADLLARRALRVNLSDLAAIGAEPVGFTLGLTLPEVDESWLQAFSDGLVSDAGSFSCPLLGGDTTRGPLSLAIQVHGLVPSDAGLTRAGASDGDGVFVSGSLGAAAAALAELENGDHAEQLFYLPEPRLLLGQRLRGLATAMLDISDGLLADLGHIAKASAQGIQIEAGRVPVSAFALEHAVDERHALELALAGGDDYELAFTAPVDITGKLDALSRELNVPITCIGRVVNDAGAEVVCRDSEGQSVMIEKPGYRHF